MIKNDSVPVFGSVHFYMNLPIISPLKFNMAHGAVFKIVLGRTFCFSDRILGFDERQLLYCLRYNVHLFPLSAIVIV